jgi:Flp pilus assembly protein TadD
LDPYYQWLGIPKEDQPPNHYRLLGLNLWEANRDVIATAADRQMSFVKQYQSGAESAEISQRLLNELMAARLCLLNPANKAQYDEQLRAASGDRPKPPPRPRVGQRATAPAVPLAAPLAIDIQQPPDSADHASVPPVLLPAASPAHRRGLAVLSIGLPTLLLLAGAGVAAAGVILGIVLSMSLREKPREPAIAVREAALPDAPTGSARRPSAGPPSPSAAASGTNAAALPLQRSADAESAVSPPPAELPRAYPKPAFPTAADPRKRPSAVRPKLPTARIQHEAEIRTRPDNQGNENSRQDAATPATAEIAATSARSEIAAPPTAVEASAPEPDPVETLIAEAQKSIARGQYDDGRKRLLQINLHERDHVQACFYLGLLAGLVDHDSTNARRNFSRARAAGLEDVACLNNLAITYARSGDGRQAIRHWREATDLQPAPDVLHNISMLFVLAQRNRVSVPSGMQEAFVEHLRSLDIELPTARGGWRYMDFPSGSAQFAAWRWPNLIDRTCMQCNGSDTANCPVRACSRGRVRVSTTDTVVLPGRHVMKKERIVPVNCSTCRGTGQVACPACVRGIDRDL